MSPLPAPSEFLRYLAAANAPDGGADGNGVPHGPHGVDGANGSLPGERVASLSELSKQLGVSVAGLREQLEVAKALGLVEVRPRTGIRRLPYSFAPAVRHSLSHALQQDPAHFEAFSSLRNHIEEAYFTEAVARLTAPDLAALRSLVAQAWHKLQGSPVQIPQAEHRQLHLLIFSRLENPFVSGLLEAYWDAYETVGLNVYADMAYLQRVWTYHQQIVERLAAGEVQAAFQALVEHKDLLSDRPARRRSTPGSAQRGGGVFE